MKLIPIALLVLLTSCGKHKHHTKTKYVNSPGPTVEVEIPGPVIEIEVPYEDTTKINELESKLTETYDALDGANSELDVARNENTELLTLKEILESKIAELEKQLDVLKNNAKLKKCKKHGPVYENIQCIPRVKKDKPTKKDK